jgi:hypothetical protein
MKALWAVAAVSFGLVGFVGTASAQPWGGGYDRGSDRGYDRGYRDEYDRGPRRREREYAFDEREYLRCNPDVRRAVNRGLMESGYVHYRRHGRGEGRRLSC